MVESLKHVKKITEEKNYKYVGFMLEDTEQAIMDEENEELVEKTLGVALKFFKDSKGDFFFIRSTDFEGVNIDTPYGCFQPFLSKFNENIYITIDEGIYTTTIKDVVVA